MKPSFPKFLLICSTFAVAANLPAFGQIVSWNAYSNFYLSPTAAGWTGDTTPSAAGAAWGYYAANVNGSGFPSQIGSYFTTDLSGSGSQSLYRYSTESPLGSATPVINTAWAATGGSGFPTYADNQSWGSSLGRYDSPWFSGAPALNNAIWMQGAWLSGSGVEGIAPVLSWTAPYTTNYVFTGLFSAGDQGANGASVAIVDSLGGIMLARTSLASTASSVFSFTNSYAAGDVVQFQVGSDFTTGNAVGLNLDIQAVPEPTTVYYLALGLGGLALGLVRRRALANRQSAE
jgi:hypothetical protein